MRVTRVLALALSLIGCDTIERLVESDEARAVRELGEHARADAEAATLLVAAIELPDEAGLEPAPTMTRLFVSGDDVMLDASARTLALLTAHGAARLLEAGVTPSPASRIAAAAELDGPDMLVVPLHAALDARRRRERDDRARLGLEESEAPIAIALPAIAPYGRLVRLVYAAGQAEHDTIHLLLEAGAIRVELPRYAQIIAPVEDDPALEDPDLEDPALEDPAPRAELRAGADVDAMLLAALGAAPPDADRGPLGRRGADVALYAHVSDAGLRLVAPRGALGPTCDALAPADSLTVARVAGELRAADLDRCFVAIAARSEPARVHVAVSAPMSLRYADVARVLAAARGPHVAPRFEHLALGIEP